MRIFGREISLKILLGAIIITGIIIGVIVYIYWFYVPTPPPYTG